MSKNQLYDEESLYKINRICDKHIISEESIVELSEAMAPLVDKLGQTKVLIEFFERLNQFDSYEIVCKLKSI